MKNYLNFETDIKNLELELEQLKDPYNQEGLSEVNTNKISQLQISFISIVLSLAPASFASCLASSEACSIVFSLPKFS